LKEWKNIICYFLNTELLWLFYWVLFFNKNLTRMETNWISIILAGLVPTILGYLWYGPVLGKQWMETTGKTEDWYREQGNMPMIMGVSLILSIMLAFGLDALIQTTHGNHYMHLSDEITGTHNTFGHGALHGAMYSAFFLIPCFVINGMFERRGPKNYWIHIAYWLISTAIMGGILEIMR